MLCLLQRVTQASVSVDGQTIAAIDAGLMVLVGVERGDNSAQAQRMAQRLLAYRVFADHAGKMNLSLAQTNGGLLLVPQFTLPANTSKGNRPSFGSAAAPEIGETLFNELVTHTQSLHDHVSTSQFGANIQVALVNDGAVTFMLRVAPADD